MNALPIRFPVTCPRCARESLAEFFLGQLAEALINGRVIRLSARCHGAVWSASEVELQQIREYLLAIVQPAQRPMFPPG